MFPFPAKKTSREFESMGGPPRSSEKKRRSRAGSLNGGYFWLIWLKADLLELRPPRLVTGDKPCMPQHAKRNGRALLNLLSVRCDTLRASPPASASVHTQRAQGWR